MHLKVVYSFYILLITLVMRPFSAVSQCNPCNLATVPPDYNSARISMISGGSLEFNFLNLTHYQNGITKANNTVIGINICNCASSGIDANSNITGWDLYMDTDDTEFVGSNPANTLPLCFLEAEATVRSGLAGVNGVNTRQPLVTYDGTATALASDLPGGGTITDLTWNADQLDITYYLGVLPTNATCAAIPRTFPIINDGAVVPDYYSASISFTLVPRCGVCADVPY